MHTGKKMFLMYTATQKPSRKKQPVQPTEQRPLNVPVEMLMRKR